MGPRLLSCIGVLVVVGLLGTLAVAQSNVPACGLPPVVAANAQPNIFSDEQEQWLGDAMADMLEREYKPARDDAQSAYLQAIVDKLARNLPPNEIKFRVLVVDSSEVNGFSLAGGHIYITRKLAAIAQNDDELASVLGHEMGHIASHQFAFETTRDLKRLLGITSVGDRADIYAKFQKLMDARMTDKHPGKSGDDDDDQGEADKVGVYVTAAAGYRAQAFAEFWDRTFFVGGKTGSRMSDFFRITKPDQKRLRGMLKLNGAPAAGLWSGPARERRRFRPVAPWRGRQPGGRGYRGDRRRNHRKVDAPFAHGSGAAAFQPRRKDDPGAGRGLGVHNDARAVCGAIPVRRRKRAARAVQSGLAENRIRHSGPAQRRVVGDG